MKRVVKASVAQEEALRNAKKILDAAKNLLNIMDSMDEGFIDNNDLGDLYDCLIEDIPALQIAVNSRTVEI